MTDDSASKYRTTEGGYTSSAMWDDAQRVADPARFPALQALQAGAHVVYAMRMPDGAIKIGCTKNLANRASGLHGKILGFRPGNFDDERAIHATLREARARGYEYYHPTRAVMAVVNELRSGFGLPDLAA